MGSLGGALALYSAVDLGAAVVSAAVERAGVKPEQVEECIMGNVLSAGLGQAPARQVAIKGGLPHSTVCTTVNKVCSSGMKAAMEGALSIKAGHADIVVAGGMESMSNAPFYLQKARFGYKYGHSDVVDGMVHDGLWDPYGNKHMGECAEVVAEEMGITREMNDAHAIESYRRAIAATDAGKFSEEIVPLTPKGAKAPVTKDEEITKVRFEKIPTLKPVFRPEFGTITAANSSPVSDGSSAMVLVSRETAERLGLRPFARILSMADYEQHPDWFPTSPVEASKLALKRAGLAVADVDFWELNQAFSTVSVANLRLLNLDAARVDVNGGAVSLGHPIGSSGARIIGTLANVLKQNDGRIGVAAICNGGGGASAVVIERL